MKLKYPLKNLFSNEFEDLGPLSCSQAGQDLFVIALTQAKRNGTWLELGACHPHDHSNTYLLEKNFDWSGISLDIVNFYHGWFDRVRGDSWPTDPGTWHTLPEWIKKESIEKFAADDNIDWANRPNTTFVEIDALEFDYSKLAPYYDYLQVDIDPPMGNYQVLEKVLKTQRFSVVTFEHDYWKTTEETDFVMAANKELMFSYGYELIVNNVTIEPGRGTSIGDEPVYFEDWYAHPDYISKEIIDAYRWVDPTLSPKYYTDILFN